MIDAGAGGPSAERPLLLALPGEPQYFTATGRSSRKVRPPGRRRQGERLDEKFDGLLGAFDVSETLPDVDPEMVVVLEVIDSAQDLASLASALDIEVITESEGEYDPSDDGRRRTPKGSSLPSPVSVLRFKDYADADVVYAILSSRLAFWLWHIQGDAFHVSMAFLRELPFDTHRLRPETKAAIRSLGRRAWSCAGRRPVLSTNGGKQSLGFSAMHRDPGLIDEIDGAVLEGFGLTAACKGFDLKAWYERVVLVDPSDERRIARLAKGNAVA